MTTQLGKLVPTGEDKFELKVISLKNTIMRIIHADILCAAFYQTQSNE